MNVNRLIVIRGRVQGVGYRAWTEVTALEPGLEAGCATGRDGSVEARVHRASGEGRGDDRGVPQRPARCQVRSIDQREASVAEVALRRRDELFSVLGTA